MDIKPQSSQPISDDQELAKVLAGVNGDDQAGQNDGSAQAMSNIVPPVAAGAPPVSPLSPEDISTTLPDGSNSQVIPGGADAEAETEEETSLPPMPEPVAPEPTSPAPAPAGDSDLEGVKSEALQELRPLVDKLNLEPSEKFDTYLLLIRSTDDKSLIAPAHEAAKLIPDETKRAEALLDIIKEIDFLSGAQQQ